MNQGPIEWRISPCSNQGLLQKWNLLTLAKLYKFWVLETASYLITHLLSLYHVWIIILIFLWYYEGGWCTFWCGMKLQHSQITKSISFLDYSVFSSLVTENGLPWCGLAPSFVQRRQAHYSNQLVFHQNVPQILWVFPVTYFGLKELGEYSWC